MNLTRLRPLTASQKEAVRAGLRSRDAFTRRRCRIVLAAAQGLSPGVIAAAVGCTHQSVRNALLAFRLDGPACLRRKRPGPSGDGAWPRSRDRALIALLRRSPREYGRPRRRWTLAMLAEVCFELGWCSRVFSGQTIRQAVERQGVPWSQAKRWALALPAPAGKRPIPA
jgi:hypothetical protein